MSHVSLYFLISNFGVPKMVNLVGETTAKGGENSENKTSFIPGAKESSSDHNEAMDGGPGRSPEQSRNHRRNSGSPSAVPKPAA